MTHKALLRVALITLVAAFSTVLMSWDGDPQKNINNSYSFPIAQAMVFAEARPFLVEEELPEFVIYQGAFIVATMNAPW